MQSKEFVKNVVSAYEKGTGIFSSKINAEELTPKNATQQEKALYLFYVIQLDYATKSQKLYEGANRLFKENKAFFDPDYILALSSKKLENILKEYLHPRYINEAKTRYTNNSQVLKSKYKSDPRLIFKTSSTAKEALKKVGEFRGFGPKIGNFFVRSMINSFNYIFNDVEDILPPVDVHDVRIAYLMGYVDADKMSTKNINTVKLLWSNACKEAGVSWLTFDKALWLLGSEGRPKSKEDVLKLLNVLH